MTRPGGDIVTTPDSCELCGGDVREHYPPVVMRDGDRGRYLAPTFVLDAATILADHPRALGDAGLSAWGVAGVLAPMAIRALRTMGNVTREGATNDEWETLDEAVADMERALDAAGFVVCWDGGYLIYRSGGAA